MTEPTRRTEADLRAAFALAAQDAPSTADVLARLEASERPRPYPPRRRSWGPIAAVAAAVVVIAVPIGFAVAHGGGSTASSSSGSLSFGSADSAGSAGSSAAKAGVPAGPQAGQSGAASATGGPANGGAPLIRPSSPSSAGRVCTPADVTLSLAWTVDSGTSTGTLTATNHSSSACDLAVKPSLNPLGTDGKPLNVPNMVSAEAYAGPSRLLPGASASSTIYWMSWCGAAASNRTEVDWGTGTSTVTASGPAAPACRATLPGGNTISSGWFGPLS